jgi:L-threonylcarbamoyladenylate synthase
VFTAPYVDFAEAVRVLARGDVVAFPTETVYGLGADATQDEAVAKIFALKGRPRDHPLIVHLAHPDWLAEWTHAAPENARRLAAAFWPGPLTLVVHPGQRLSRLVTGGLPTVAVRVPEHALARELIEALGRPVAAPSANRFGRLSPTNAAHVAQEFGSEVAILDGGVCSVGVESTIVDLTHAVPAILRPGGVTRESLESALGVRFAEPSDRRVRVPGSLASHYAPLAEVVILSPTELIAAAERLAGEGSRVGLLLFGGVALHASGIECVVLPEDLELAAQRLYGALRDLDARGCEQILLSLPSETGIGSAIADRLRRAAGPRD